MTPLKQRFIEDMQLGGLAPTTQRGYIPYVAEFAKFYNAARKSSIWKPSGNTKCIC